MSDNPNLAKIQLGRFLREYRLRAGLKPGEPEIAKIAKSSKLKNIEAGRVQSVRYADVLAFGSTYKISREELNNLTELQEASEKPGWYHRFDVSDQFATFLTMEAVATRLIIVENEFITGLFQIPEYVDALREFNLENKGGADKGTKLERKEHVLNRETPPEVIYITSEAALRRQVGGSEVMQAQIAELVAMAERPNIEIRVLTFDQGPHHLMFGPFTIMEFDGREFPTTVYLESLDGSRYEEGARYLDLYRSAFDRTLPQAITIKDYTNG